MFTSFNKRSHNILLIFVGNLFLAAVYIALSSEIAFGFFCFVLHVILTLL